MYNDLLRFNKHILNEQGNPAWGSAAFIPTFENAAYGIEWTKDDNGQDTDKAIRVLLFGGRAHGGSEDGSGLFHSDWVRSNSGANVGFFTTVKLD